jgi:PBP1b-binding outer membrane lipoprotein LpoB
MKKRLFAAALLALTLAGCVVVPARPVYYRPAPVVIY